MTSAVRPAIVIVGYRRPAVFARLLRFICAAKYPCEAISLIISLDGDCAPQCIAYAEQLSWEWGNKRIIVRDKHLGLRKHILSCGDLVEEYGEIILLEEDLGVAPTFYEYAASALHFYRNASEVAGISLYSYDYSELRHFRFTPIFDGYDNYFMQWPSSWGQAWTRDQWRRFRAWYADHEVSDFSGLPIPESVQMWPESSWKKYFVAYLVAENKYFVYPRVSLSTNFGDTGVHQRKGFASYGQVALAQGAPETFRFSDIEEAVARYDSFFQLEGPCLQKLAPSLKGYQITLDLEGVRPLETVSTPYLLSTRRCLKPIASYDISMKPYEVNVIAGNTGRMLFLGRKEHFTSGLTWIRDFEILTRADRILAPADYAKIILSRLLLKVRQKWRHDTSL